MVTIACLIAPVVTTIDVIFAPMKSSVVAIRYWLTRVVLGNGRETSVVLVVRSLFDLCC